MYKPFCINISWVVGGRNPESYTGDGPLPTEMDIVKLAPPCPLVVAPNTWLEIHTARLQNKYPWDKPYTDDNGDVIDKRSQMYFKSPVFTISAHDPSQHWWPPLRFPWAGLAGGTFWLKIVNNMQEEQNIWVTVMGFVCSENDGVWAPNGPNIPLWASAPSGLLVPV